MWLLGIEALSLHSCECQLFSPLQGYESQTLLAREAPVNQLLLLQQGPRRQRTEKPLRYWSGPMCLLAKCSGCCKILPDLVLGLNTQVVTFLIDLMSWTFRSFQG